MDNLFYSSTFFVASEPDCSSSVSYRSCCLHQRGRALNVLPQHSAEAERLLSRAVKLQPDLVDAWNELGESYAKRQDTTNARTCFEGALKQVILIHGISPYKNILILMCYNFAEVKQGELAQPVHLAADEFWRKQRRGEDGQHRAGLDKS